MPISLLIIVEFTHYTVPRWIKSGEGCNKPHLLLFAFARVPSKKLASCTRSTRYDLAEYKIMMYNR